MIELPLPYVNELAKQISFISTFLGGFSLTLLGTLILSDKEGRLIRALIVSTAISSLAFVVAVMAMTQLTMISTEGYPFQVDMGQLNSSRTMGTLALFVGVLALMTTIAMSGWMRSKRLGIITTILGALTFFALLFFS
ncbi:MAG: hypothetical protein AAFZ63_06365 [Bacteroidota bacterium]